MDGLAQLPERCPERDVGRHFLDDIGGMCSEDMGAEQLAFLGLAAQLHHSLGLVHCQSLAVGAVETLVALERHALFLQLIFRGTDASGLRLGEDSGRHEVETYLVLDAEDAVHDMYALHLRRMGQHLTAVDVANGKTLTIDH